MLQRREQQQRCEQDGAESASRLAVALLAGCGLALLVRARRDGEPGRRLGAVLLAALLLLAALEHALLGSTRDPGWWNAFLAWRELR